MQINLPIAVYKFCFRAIDPVSLPAFADPLWRSVFGLALRQFSCVTDHDDCNTCMLLHQCDYSFLTTGPNSLPQKTGIIKNLRAIPNPHIFHGQVRDYSTEIPKTKTFSANIILIGNANDRLPAVIRAMVQVGMLGLGRKRPKSRLLEVVQTGPGPLSRLIVSNQEIIAAGHPESLDIPKSPQTIRLSFITPYLLPKETLLEDGFNASRFLSQLIRRVSFLQESYTTSPLDADFKYLKSLTEISAIFDADLDVEPRYRYHGNKKVFCAVQGGFIMDLQNLEDLWPWLYLGQWLNVGKQASKGFGRYELTVID